MHIEMLLRARDTTRRIFDQSYGSTREWARKTHFENEKVKTSFMTVRTAVLGVGGVLSTLATGALAAFISRSIDAAEALDKMSQRTGVAVERLSTLDFVAQQTGADLPTLETALKGLHKKLQEALVTGTGEGASALAALGIELKTSTGEVKSNIEILEEVADAFAKHADGAGKSAIAQKLFEESGTKLIPMLNLGSEGIHRLEQRARDLGAEISTETAVASANFTDRMNELDTAVKGLGISITSDLLPDLTNIANMMLEGYKQGGLYKSVLLGVAEAIQALGQATGLLRGNAADRMQVEMEELSKTLPALRREIEARTRRFNAADDRMKMLPSGELSGPYQRELEEMVRLQAKIVETEKRLSVLREAFQRQIRPEGLGVRKGEREEENPQLQLQEKTSPGKSSNADSERTAREAAERRRKFEEVLADEDLKRGDDRMAQEAQRQYDAWAREDEAKAELAQKVLEDSEMFGASELQALEIRQGRELAAVEGHEAAQDAIRRKYGSLREQALLNQKARSLAVTSQTYGALANLALQGSGRVFKIGQALNLAQAISAAWAARAQAHAHPPGPPTTLPMARIAFINGMAAAAGVASTTFGGGASSGGGGGGGDSGGSYSPAPVVAPPPPITSDPGQVGSTGIVATFHVYGDALDAEQFAKRTAEKIAELSRFGQVPVQVEVRR